MNPGLRSSEVPRAAAVVLLAAASVASATTYYLNDPSTQADLVPPGCTATAPGQEETACGTCEVPCSSLREALAVLPLAAGDTLFLNTGTYPALGTTDYPSLSFEATSAAPLTLQGASDGGVPLAVLDANEVAYYCLDLSNASFVRVQDLACQGATQAGLRVWASQGIELRRLAIRATANAHGIEVDDSTSLAAPITIDGCDISGAQNGIVLSGSNLSIQVTDNRLHDNPGTALQAYFRQPGTTTLIRGNTVFGNGFDGLCYPAIHVVEGPSVTVSHNTVYGNGCSGISAECSGSTCSYPVTDLRIENNTLHDNLRLGGPYGELSVSGCGSPLPVVRNNIVSFAGPAGEGYAYTLRTACTGLSSNFNTFYKAGSPSLPLVCFGGTTSCSNTYATLADFRTATALDAQSLDSNPLFVNATSTELSARSYHVRSQAGHWTDAGWQYDTTATSPTLDKGDPASPFSLEPPCNGGRVNQGATGNTATASRSFGTCPATSLAVAGVTSPRAAGTPASFTVEALDASGGRVTSYTGTVRFTSSDGSATLPGNYTFTAADQGQHTFAPGVTFRSAGIHALTATDLAAANVTGSQRDIVVEGVSGPPSLNGWPCGCTQGTAGALTLVLVGLLPLRRRRRG